MSTVPNTISKQCSAVVLYGITPNARAAEGFYRTVVEWFTNLGYPPDKLGVGGTGHSGKLGSFNRGNAKLQKRGFDRVVDFEVISSTPNAITGHGYFLTATYYSEALYAGVVARSSLATLSPTSMLPVARTLAQVLKPSYGIGYTMEHRRGPELYAVGINFGTDIPTGEAYEEARNISRWCDLGMVEQVYREGLLRDVYPWNFLTEPQLHRSVGGKSLERWIGEDRGRGSLSPLVENVVLWEVEESRIPELRRSLHEAGVIFDWRKYQ